MPQKINSQGKHRLDMLSSVREMSHAPRENGEKNKTTLFSSVKNTCKCIKMFSFYRYTEVLLQCRKWE